MMGGQYAGRDGVILQSGPVDCGVAAMKMIVAERGYAPSALDALQATVLARGRGLSLLEMQQALKALGLRAEGRRMNLVALGGAPFPVIAHFPSHFVVIDGRGADGRWIVRDPEVGRVRLDDAGLTRLWDGDVLIVSGTGDRPSPPGDRGDFAPVGVGATPVVSESWSRPTDVLTLR